MGPGPDPIVWWVTVIAVLIGLVLLMWRRK